MKRQSFVPIFALIAVAVFMGVMGVSSFVLQNNKSSLTYKTRAAEGDGPGGQCTGCGGEDGCRAWEKCEGGSCQDTTNGGANPASGDSCGGGGGGGGEDPNACPCDKQDSCYNGRWCGNDCKFHDDNAYRCSPNQPTIPLNAPRDCTSPESCVPPGTVGGRWCGNDWKFHDEANYKCQPVPPTPAGSRQCTAPESCQNERWCGNDYSYHDDLNYIKGCQKKLTGIGANSFCTNHDECVSGFCLNNNCAEKPTPTPQPTAIPVVPAPQVSETPTVPKTPTADITSPSQCPFTKLSYCTPECSPVECREISTIPNCFYCPTDYQTTPPPQQSQSACTGSFSTILLECNGLCGEKCRSHPSIPHCFYCPLDFPSDASEGSQATCPDTKIYNNDDNLNQVIDCVKDQAPKYISRAEYDKRIVQSYASSLAPSCPLEKIGTTIKVDETHCFKCESPYNVTSIDPSECQDPQAFSAPRACACGSSGKWIGNNCDDLYRGKSCDDSKTITPEVPVFVLTPVNNCTCESTTNAAETTYVWSGSDCDREMRGESCEDYASKEFENYQKNAEIATIDNKKEKLESKMAICKSSRCMGTGTCLPTPDETDVKCYPFSTTQKDSTIPDDCGDTGQQCCTSESTTAGYDRRVITNTTSFCVSGRNCVGGRCLPDPNFETALAVAEELRKTKSMTADQRNNFIINNLGTDKKTTEAFAKIADNLCGDTCITGACVYSEKEQKYTCVDEQKIKKYFQTEYANPENEGQRGELDGPCISRAPGILAGGPKCNSSMLDCKSGFCEIKSKEIETRFANDILVKEGANSETTARGNLLITGNSTTAELMSDKKFAAPGCTERDKLFSSGGACWVCVDEKNKIMNQVDFQLCDSSIKSKVEAKLPGKGCHSAGGYCAPQTTSCNGAGDASAGDCVSEFKCCMPDESKKNLIGQTIGLGLGEACGDENTKNLMSSTGVGGQIAGKLLVKSCSSGLKCFEKHCQEETTLAFSETYQTQRGNIIAEKIPVLGSMIAGISASGTREYYRSQTVRGYYADSLATTAINEMQSVDSTYLDREKQDQIYSSIMQQSADSGARGQILARKGNLNGAGKAGLSASNWANTWNGNLNVNDVTDVVEMEQYLNQQIRADGRPEDVDTIKKQLTTLRFQAGMNIGLAAVDVIGTAATLGGSSLLTKAGTTVAGQGVKLAVKEVAKEGVELAAKEGARAVAGRALIATGRGIEYVAKGAELVDKSQMVVFGGATLASSVVLPAVQGKSISEIAEAAPSNLLPGMSMVIGTQLGGKVVSKTLGFALPAASKIADDALLSTGLKKYSSERIARDALQEATNNSLGKSLTEAEVRASAVEIANKQISQLGSGRVEKNVWEAIHPQGGATTLLPIQQAIEGVTKKSELAQAIQKAVPAPVSQDQIAHLQQMAGTGVSPEVILKKAAEDTSADGVRILGNTMEDRIAAAKGFVEARKIVVANAPAKLTSTQQSSLISGVAEIFEKAKGAGAPVKLADAMDVIAKKTEGQLSPSSIFATVKEIERSGAGIISGTGIRDVLSPNGIVNRTVGDPPNPLRGVDTSAIRATQEFIDGKFDDLQSKFGLTPEQKIALQEERIAAESNAGLPAQHVLTPNNIKTSKYVTDEFDTLHPEASTGKPVEVRSREDLARQVLHDWNMLDPAKGTAQAIDNFTDPIQISKALQYADELLAQNKAKLAGSVQKVVGGAGQIHILPDQAARIVPQSGKEIKINGAEVPASGTFLRKGDVVLGGETALVYKGAGQLADQTAELAKKLGTTADQLREGIRSGKFTSVKLDSGASYIVGPKNNGRVARAADSPGLFGGIKDAINERFGVQLDQARAVAAGTAVPAPPPSIISRARQTLADARQSLTNTIDNLRNRRNTPPAPPATPKSKDVAKKISDSNSPKDIEEVLAYDPNGTGTLPNSLQGLSPEQVGEVQLQLESARAKRYVVQEVGDGVVYIDKKTKQGNLVRTDGTIDNISVDPNTGQYIVNRGKIVQTKTGAIYLVEDDGTVTRLVGSDRIADKVKETFLRKYPDEVQAALPEGKKVVKNEPEPNPTKTPKPTNGPQPTKTPKPTGGPNPTKAPNPTSIPKPTKAPIPTVPIPTKPHSIPTPQPKQPKQPLENRDFAYKAPGTEQTKIKIGKSSTNDILLPDEPGVYHSREHAEITFEPQGIYAITDTSSNGTFINGKLVGRGNKKPIKTGDVVRFTNDDASIMVVEINPKTNELLLRKPVYDDAYYAIKFDPRTTHKVQIGSDGKSDVKLVGSGLAPTEASIEFSGGRYVINGRKVSINGKNITNSTPIYAGDIISVGSPARDFLVDVSPSGVHTLRKPLNHDLALASDRIEDMLYGYQQVVNMNNPTQIAQYKGKYEQKIAEYTDDIRLEFIQRFPQHAKDFVEIIPYRGTAFASKGSIDPDMIKSIGQAMQLVRTCKTGCSTKKLKTVMQERVKRYFPGRTIDSLSESELVILALRKTQVDYTGLKPNVVALAQAKVDAQMSALAQKYKLTYQPIRDLNEDVSQRTMIILAQRGENFNALGLASGNDLIYSNKALIKTEGEYRAVQIHELIHTFQKQNPSNQYEVYSARPGDASYTEVLTEWFTKRQMGSGTFGSGYDAGVVALNKLLRGFDPADLEKVEAFSIKGDSKGLRNWLKKQHNVDLDSKLSGYSDYDFYQQAISS